MTHIYDGTSSTGYSNNTGTHETTKIKTFQNVIVQYQSTFPWNRHVQNCSSNRIKNMQTVDLFKIIVIVQLFYILYQEKDLLIKEAYFVKSVIYILFLLLHA
jgi:hypothetical protein